MPFQIIVREIKARRDAQPGQNVAPPEQIYEQTVEVLDLSKVLAAVNHKPRVRKIRTPGTART